MSKPPHSHFDTSTLLYERQSATWRDVVNVRAQLKETLSQTRVGVSIQYTKPVTR